jgi:flagellar hook-basal body complex protein FliE
MKIGSLQSIIPDLTKLANIEKKEDTGFNEMLSSLVSGANNDQLQAEKLVKDFSEGKEVELHEVMIAGEKAKTTLELLMEIRNKTIDMYKELTRIQI